MEDVLARLGVTSDQIADFCRKWHITRLELFGSVLRDDFDEQSDVDVLVTFGEGRQVLLEDLMGMETELTEMFGRLVDVVKRNLVETNPNPIRRKSILDSARLVYAAA